MSARDDYRALASWSKSPFGAAVMDARRALDEIDQLRAERDAAAGALLDQAANDLEWYREQGRRHAARVLGDQSIACVACGGTGKTRIHYAAAGDGECPGCTT